MWVARYSWIVLLILLAPAVSAYSIDSAWLASGNSPIGAVTPGAQISVSLMFQTSADFATNCTGTCAMILNSDTLPLTNHRVDINTCSLVNGTKQCSVGPFSLIAQSSYDFTYYTQAGTERIPDQTATVTLTTSTPSEQGYTITSGSLFWNNMPVTTISSSKSLPNTMLRITLSEAFATCTDCSVTIANVGTATNCLTVNTTKECVLGPFTFSTSTSPATFSYSVRSGTLQDTSAQTFTIPITIDDTQPSVTDITTGYCDDSNCYVAAGVASPVTIEMTDSVTAFDFKLVFLGTGTGVTQVKECIGSSCTGSVIVPCKDGQSVEMNVRSVAGVSSREDAQNDVVGGGKTVLCAGKAPKIVSWDESSDGLAGLPVAGSTSIFTAEVESFTGSPSGVAKSTVMSGTDIEATCADNGGTYICVWNVPTPTAGTFDLTFEVYDAVGNFVVRDTRITVLQLKQTPGNKSIDFFTSSVTSVSPKQLNRIALELAAENFLPYPAYVNYNLQLKSGSAVVVKQQLTDCQHKINDDDEFTAEYAVIALGASSGNRPETHVFNPEANWDEPNRLDLSIRASRSTLMLSDKFETSCLLNLYVQEGNALYAVPEQERIVFTLEFRESSFGDPGSNFLEKMNETREDLTGTTARLIRNLEKYRQMADKVCRMAETYITVHNTAAAIALLGDSACGIPVVGTAIKAIGNAIFTPVDSIMEWGWNGMSPLGGPIGQMINRAKKATEINSAFGIIPNNNMLLQPGGPIRHFCRQVNCRATADLTSAAFGNPAKQAELKAERDKNREQTLKDAADKYGVESETYRQMSQQGISQAPDAYSGGMFFQGRDNYLGMSCKNTEDCGMDERLGSYVENQVLSNANIANPESSITAAVSTMCIGGVIYNFQKYQAIDCAYLQCLKEQSIRGHSISVCEEAKAYQYCSNLVGEVMELPGVNAVNNIVNRVNHAVSNAPAFLAKFFLNEACNNDWSLGNDPTAMEKRIACFATTGCVVGSSVINTIDVMEQSKQAYGGLSDVGAAEYALQICDIALNDAEELEPYDPSFIDKMAIRYGAFQNNAYALSKNSPASEFVGTMQYGYIRANQGTEDLPLPIGYTVGAPQLQPEVGKPRSEWTVTTYEVTPTFAEGVVAPDVQRIYIRQQRYSDVVPAGEVTKDTPRLLTTVNFERNKKSIVKQAGGYADVVVKAAGGGLQNGMTDMFSASKAAVDSRDPTKVEIQDPKSIVRDVKGNIVDDGTQKVTDDLTTEPQGTANDVVSFISFTDNINVASGLLRKDSFEYIAYAHSQGVSPANADEARSFYIYDTAKKAIDNDWLNVNDILAEVESYETQITAIQNHRRELLNSLESSQLDVGEAEKALGNAASEETTTILKIVATKISTKTEEVEKAVSITSGIVAPVVSPLPASDTMSFSDFLESPTSNPRSRFYDAGLEVKNLESYKSLSFSQKYDFELKYGLNQPALKTQKDYSNTNFNIVAEYNTRVSNMKELVGAITTTLKSSENTNTIFSSDELKRLGLPENAYHDSFRDTYNGYTREYLESMLVGFNGYLTEVEKVETEDYPASIVLDELEVREKIVSSAEQLISGTLSTLEVVTREKVIVESEVAAASDALKQVRDAAQSNNQEVINQITKDLANRYSDFSVAGIRDDVGAQKDYIEKFLKNKEQELARNVEELEQKRIELVENYPPARAEYIRSLLSDLDSSVRPTTPEAIAKFTDACAMMSSCSVDDVKEALEEGKMATAMLELDAGLKIEDEKVKLLILEGKNVKFRNDLQKFSQAIGFIADYASKWLYDKGVLRYLQLSGWSTSIADFSEHIVFDDRVTNLLCEADITVEGGDGVIYQQNYAGSPTVAATFATEVRAIKDTTGTSYVYITVAHVESTDENGHLMDIVFTGLKDCVSSCPQEYRLLNNRTFNISSTTPFSNGGLPNRQIKYLPGLYENVCLRFDRQFPDASGQKEYCRTIREDAFDRGGAIVQPEETQNQFGRTGNPLEEWS